MKHKHIILTSILMLFGLNAFSIEISPNSVYRIKNNSGRYMSVSASNAVTDIDNASDKKQEWFFVPNQGHTGFYLRNVQSGAYLRSPHATSQMWTMHFVENPTNEMLMIFEDNDGMVVFHPYGYSGYNYAHNDAANNVVCWTASSANTKWTLEKVEKTAEELEKIQNDFINIGNEIAKAPTYEEHLDRLFTDKSCTELRDKNIDLDSNEDYNALSPLLKRMVRKIHAGNIEDWAESYTYEDKDYQWDGEYAERYRVQLYEPYSEGMDAASMAGIQPYTNMNNPTGIVGDGGELMYVMVKEDIPEGATLYINEVPDTGMYNGTTPGTKLHKGLNILLCNKNNSHYFIYYVVNTADRPSGSNRYLPTKYNLKDFNPLTIHIEGGRINGFFNHIGDERYGQDDQERFNYTVQRATHPMYDFLGKHVILHLHLFDTPSHEGETPNRCVKSALFESKRSGDGIETDPVLIMKAWDKMCLAEKVMMGVTSLEDMNDPYNKGLYESIIGTNDSYQAPDGTEYSMDPGFRYDEYFNNRMMGISMQGDLFMNATSYRTAYNVSTIEAILTQFCAGNIWGPAHEYGHINQSPMKMAGTTEESNNIYSNVATYYAGVNTSRSDFISSQFKLFQENQTFLEHGTWGTTRMFWQLWCYYHAAGHNKKFYPRLLELLRNHPLKLSTIPNEHREVTDKLHFAKMCCIAAQEDLTNFFTAWGFFVPLDGYVIEDYSSFKAYLTQDEIDAVKAEIKSYGFPVNNSIILIDDRPGVGDERASFGGFPKEKAGELGGIEDFKDNKTNPSGNFSFTVRGNTVTVDVDGENGVGYLLWDAEGNLLGFSNSNTFDVNEELASKIINGEVILEAVGADNQTKVQAVNIITDGTPDQKREVLANLIADANKYLAYVDNTFTKVGYLLPGAVTDLMSLIEAANDLLENEETDSQSVTDAIQNITNTYNALLVNPDALVGVDENYTYTIKNVGRSYYLSCDGNNVVGKENKSTSSDEGLEKYETQWIIKKLDNGNYTLKNVAYDRYVSVSSNVSLSFTPCEFTLTPVGGQPGKFYISANGVATNSIGLQADNKVNKSSTGSLNAQWTITRESDLRLSTTRKNAGRLMEIALQLNLDATEKLSEFYDSGDNDAWFDLYLKMDALTDSRKTCNNTLNSTDETVILPAMSDLYEKSKIVADIIGVPYASLTIGASNDGNDETADSGVIRHAFNTDEENTSLTLTHLISSDNKLTDTDISVTVTPIDGDDWANSAATTQEQLDEEYFKAFEETAPDSQLGALYRLLDTGRVDGFFTNASGKLVESGTDARGNHLYDLVIDLPCSGVYSVALNLDVYGYIFTSETFSDPGFEVIIYPNLADAIGNDKSFNIERYTFKDSDNEHNKTITIDKGYIPPYGWTECMAFIPGIYFVQDFKVTIENEETDDTLVDTEEELASDRNRYNVKRRNEEYEYEKPKADASVYYTPVDLTSFSTLPEGNRLKAYVTVTKNGATANYMFYIEKGTDFDVTTEVDNIEVKPETMEYYDLNGLRVNNPGQGIFIVKECQPDGQIRFRKVIKR